MCVQREDEADDEEARWQGDRTHGQDSLPPERDRTTQQGKRDFVFVCNVNILASGQNLGG